MGLYVYVFVVCVCTCVVKCVYTYLLLIVYTWVLLGLCTCVLGCVCTTVHIYNCSDKFCLMTSHFCTWFGCHMFHVDNHCCAIGHATFGTLVCHWSCQILDWFVMGHA